MRRAAVIEISDVSFNGMDIVGVVDSWQLCFMWSRQCIGRDENCAQLAQFSSLLPTLTRT